MHEFDKCHFCISYDPTDDWCRDPLCDNHAHYVLDVNKILKKADERNISVTDVLNLIRECNPKPKPKDAFDETLDFERRFLKNDD